MDIELISIDVDEARKREESFLGRLADAQDDYEWIVEHQAWVQLGHDTFADWWTTRVQPQMRALSMRPTREIAARVIEQVRTEEAELPPAQQRTQRELAELVGVTQQAVSARSAPHKELYRADLDEVVATPIEEPAPVPQPADDARLHAALDAELDHTAARFRANFTRAVAHADDVWQFDLDRIVELYAGTYERDLQPFLDEMTAWCARVSSACRQRRSGLRLVAGGDR